MTDNKWLRTIQKIQPYNMVKGIRYLQHFGWKQFWIRLSERMEPEEVPYGPWYDHYRPTEQELSAQRAACSKMAQGGPVFSILVPVFHTPENYLQAMIESVLAQTYGGWELCLVQADPSDTASTDRLETYARRDARIKVRVLEENKGISGNTNEALAMASGDWIALLDHDDMLSPAALYQARRFLQKQPDCCVLYTDEDKIREEGGTLEHLQPSLKPDFNLDLLRSNNYITHFLMVRRDCVPAGGLRPEYDGAQDYDFIFRCVEGREKQVGHIPEILYHWRIHAASTSDNPISKQYAYEAGRRAIEAHLERCGLTNAEVEAKKDFGFYRVRYKAPESRPTVSVLIPNCDHADMMKRCISSVLDKSTYPNLEVLIIENNSVEEATFRLYEELQRDERIRVLRWEGGFNYAAINNFGARHVSGEYLLLLNNDIEVISPDWIEEMLGVCSRREVGAVGARLYYPDDTYQHAGIVIGIGGVAGSMFVNMKRGRGGYLHKAELMQDLSAVTAACMMLRRDVFEKTGGFEEKLSVAFNDVDLCLRLRKEGYLVVYDPYAELYHYESRSRGKEDTKEKVRRFQTEIEFMRTRWEALLRSGDPMYNKNLSVTKWNYSLKDGERMR